MRKKIKNMKDKMKGKYRKNDKKMTKKMKT